MTPHVDNNAENNLPTAPPPSVVNPTQPGGDKPSRWKLFIKAAVGRSMGSLFWHLFFNVFMNWTAILWAIGAAAAGIAALIGWKVSAPESGQRKAESIAAKAKQSVGEVLPGAKAGVSILPFALPFTKTPEQVEADRKRRLETLRAEADVYSVKYEESWSVERLEVFVGKAKEDALEAKKEAAAEAKRKDRREREGEAEQTRQTKLAAQAQKATEEELAERSELLERIFSIAGTIMAPDTSTERLREVAAEVMSHRRGDDEFQAKYLDWRKAVKALEDGPNAACPSCNYKMRLGKNRVGTQGVCPSCSQIFPCRTAFARFTPPRPPKEPEKPKGYTDRRGEIPDSLSYEELRDIWGLGK